MKLKIISLIVIAACFLNCFSNLEDTATIKVVVLGYNCWEFRYCGMISDSVFSVGSMHLNYYYRVSDSFFTILSTRYKLISVSPTRLTFQKTH